MTKEKIYPVNLPKIDFSMRADLPKKEPKILEFWQNLNLYEKIMEARSLSEKFILHDGPPYANGPIHMGQALNKTLKDIIVRYKNLAGFRAPFIPGWDSHGLPIEQALLKNLRITQKEAREAPVAFRKKCREFVLKMLELQREDFKRLGCLGDWDHPYVTMELPYAAKIVEAFIKINQKGFIYRGLKPVFWCLNCETALAHAEIEYTQKSSPSIYVRFDVVEPKNTDLSLVIWTTTPWTLPANRAICVHPQATYRVLKKPGEKGLIVLESLSEKVAKIFEAQITEKTYIGKELALWKVLSPLAPQEKNHVPVIFDEKVELGEGTGVVHIAPGHGEEDYFLAKKFKDLGLEIASPVDASGHFTQEVGREDLAGLRINLDQTTQKLLQYLNQTIIHQDRILHSYPHCWRCKQPVIFRATEQWFLNMEHKDLRKKILKAIEGVRWFPQGACERIKSMIEGRPDWCLSRQRIWGAPIPILYCKNCGQIQENKKLFEAIVQKISSQGEDSWFEPSGSFLREWGKNFPCPRCGSQNLIRDPDILDVWLDSGVSWHAVCKEDKNLHFPSDIYLEGSDQHRGWFQTSLITSCALTEEPPYKTVYTHGWVLDDQGRAMHKSLGNVVSPQEIIKDWGADILRLWAASTESLEDVRISKRLMNVHAENYKKIRNTIRYMLGNINDFDPHRDGISSYENLGKLEQWALFKLYQTLVAVKNFYENYEFSKVLRAILEFSVHELSNFYFDISKDCLYTSKANDKNRRAAQSVLVVLLYDYLTMLAPILPFTTEEAWQELLKRLSKKDSVLLCNVKILFPESIHLNLFPLACADWKNDFLAKDIPTVLDIRSSVNKGLDLARKDKGLGSSLEAKVEITTSQTIFQTLLNWESLLPTIFIVSQVRLNKELTKKDSEIRVSIDRAEGRKCARCWIYHTSVGNDSRDPNLCVKCIQVLFN